MKLSLSIASADYHFDTSAPIDISIPLDFHGAQPNAFFLPRASGQAAEGGEFIGDVRRGGSCNCETLVLNPHGNGTHTECIGHVTGQRVAVVDALHDSIIPAVLVTVPVRRADEFDTSGLGGVRDGDGIIAAENLANAIGELGEFPREFLRGLVIRTLPNLPDKRHADYSGSNPPYLPLTAMQHIRSLGVEHLLVDLPSVDREDDPDLKSHHIFWDMPEGNDEPNELRSNCTITEMIFVPDDIPDGLYMLNLQIPAFLLDAAPSRPLLYAV